MTLKETIAHVEAAHLMVRDGKEWDGLASDLWGAYNANDDELIAQLQPPFLQSWRTVTTYVLRDTFDAAGISVADPSHPWGIATLAIEGASREPLLCRDGEAAAKLSGAQAFGGFELLTFSEAMSHYADCLAQLLDQRR